MSTITKTFMAALIASAVGGGFMLSAGTAYAGPHCSFPPGATQPICINTPTPGAAVGAVVAQPSREPRCYYLPTVANGAVNGLRRVCQYY